MVDPTGILGFLHGLSKEWTDPSVAIISPLSAITDEPVYKEAKEQGCDFRWSKEGNLRKRFRDGWRPLKERDGLGRPTIFMDSLREQIFLCRTPDKGQRG